MTADLVGPVPTITFHGAGPRVRQPYEAPRSTCDLRARLCTDHRPACDCREAEFAEQLAEYRAEWKWIRDTAWSALAGHQVEHPWGLTDLERVTAPRCWCSGCVIHRETRNLLPFAAIDHRTGRVRPAPGTGEVVPFG